MLNRIYLGESVSVMNSYRLSFFTLSPKQYSEIIISTAPSLHIGYLKSSRDDLNYLGAVQAICKYSTILYSTECLLIQMWAWGPGAGPPWTLKDNCTKLSN